MTEKEFKSFFDNNFDSLRSYLYYRSGNQDLATDLAQETFIKIWEKQLTDEGKRTIGLAYKIASDLFVSKFRRKSTELNYLNSLELEFYEVSPHYELEDKELQERYEQTLIKMPEKQRIVFLMSRMEGLKYIEIAERLGISVKAVEKRMHGALSIFRNVFSALLHFLFLITTIGQLFFISFNLLTINL